MKLRVNKLIFLLAVLSLLYFPGNVQANSGDYIIFRAQIAEMYIENATAPMRVRAIYYASNSIPQSLDIEIPYTITGPDNYKLQSSVTIRSGQDMTINLPPMHKGHYHIDIHAEAKGVSSEPLRQDFAVSPAPVPYELSLSDDGAHLFFRSKQLNETAQPDPNFPFTIEIYSYRLHAGESLVTKYSNISELDMDIPQEYRHGIITIDIIDRWGWRNGDSVDISNSIFTGYPLQYDYDYQMREPYKSRTPMYFAYALITIAFFYIMAILIRRRFEGV